MAHTHTHTRRSSPMARALTGATAISKTMQAVILESGLQAKVQTTHVRVDGWVPGCACVLQGASEGLSTSLHHKSHRTISYTTPQAHNSVSGTVFPC